MFELCLRQHSEHSTQHDRLHTDKANYSRITLAAGHCEYVRL